MTATRQEQIVDELKPAWVKYSERRPTVAGVYRWRMPCKYEQGAVVTFFSPMRMRGNGYSPDCLSPQFDHWDGYRVHVPAEAEWQEAGEGAPSVKDCNRNEGLVIDGRAPLMCAFCDKVPTLHGVRECSSGGIFVCAAPFQYNRWWLECCRWGNSPHLPGVVELIDRWNSVIGRPEVRAIPLPAPVGGGNLPPTVGDAAAIARAQVAIINEVRADCAVLEQECDRLREANESLEWRLTRVRGLFYGCDYDGIALNRSQCGLWLGEIDDTLKAARAALTPTDATEGTK